MKFPFLNNEKMPRRVKKLFTPDRDFVGKTKDRFLAAFDAAHPEHARAGAGADAYAYAGTGSRFIFILRIFAVGAVAAAVMVGGISAYADTTNVPVTSPLYSLKRLGESVQLALTPPAAKPEVQATFATRRATEITDLAERNPKSTLLPQLAVDLETDVRASLGGAEHEGGGNRAAVTSTNATSTPATSSAANGSGTPAFPNAIKIQGLLGASSSNATGSATGTEGRGSRTYSAASTGTQPENFNLENHNSNVESDALQKVCNTLRPILNIAASSQADGALTRLQAALHSDITAQCGTNSFLNGNTASSTSASSTTSSTQGHFPTPPHVTGRGHLKSFESGSGGTVTGTDINASGTSQTSEIIEFNNSSTTADIIVSTTVSTTASTSMSTMVNVTNGHVSISTSTSDDASGGLHINLPFIPFPSIFSH